MTAFTVEPAGVSEERLAELVGRVAVDYVTDTGKVNRRELATICGELLAARQQLAELQQTINHLGPSCASLLDRAERAEQQLAEMRGALSDARNRFANMADEAYATRNAKAVYDAAKGWVARSQVDAQLGRDACEAALAPTSQPAEPHPFTEFKNVLPEPTSQPSRGKKLSLSEAVEAARGHADPVRDLSAMRGDCAQPERQGAATLVNLPECDCVEFCRRSSLMKDHPERQFWCRVLKPSPPPTDDIVAELIVYRDMRNTAAPLRETLDLAIAVLKTRK